MAQNSQASKSKWGVGSFFQQAVAGVESRLDNILMDQEDAEKASNAKSKDAESTASPISRSPAGCKWNSRKLDSIPANSSDQQFREARRMRAEMIDSKNVWHEQWSNPIPRIGTHNRHLVGSLQLQAVQRRAMARDQVWTSTPVLQLLRVSQMI